MFVYTGEFCLLVQTIQNPILWGDYDLRKKILADDWERRDGVNFEDLPESVRKIIERNAA
jgi:hypothetical protein